MGSPLKSHGLKGRDLKGNGLRGFLRIEGLKAVFPKPNPKIQTTL
jgi:hypothetical protein